MENLHIEVDKEVLTCTVHSNEESFFSLLKVYLEADSGVDIVGVYKDHHLSPKTQLVIKVKKGDPKTVFKKILASVKKDLESKKVK